MLDRLFDRIGDCNPQLLRELRGRLKWPGLLLGMAISIVFQGLFWLVSYNRLPRANPYIQNTVNKYCTGVFDGYGSYYPTCITNDMGGFVINWRLWWFDSFHDLGLISFFALAVAGVYLLINDLHREEKHGTLNFIRLSPTSGRDVLRGKMLGVPVLLYGVIGLALPLHVWAGIASDIPVVLIALWYGVVVLALRLFYSAAALFALSTSWLNGIQPWIGSATTLFGLLIVGSLKMPNSDVALSLNLFNPVVMLSHLAIAADINGSITSGQPWNTMWSYLTLDVRWFYLPMGLTALSAGIFMMLNYSLWTYWVWQGLERNFRNPNATLLSKRQSYGVVLCVQGVLLGFISQGRFVSTNGESYPFPTIQEFSMIFGLNLLLLLGLVAALSPHRQALYDWARYRHDRKNVRQRGGRNTGLIWDLVWGETSPALVAIAINIGMIAAAMVPIMLWHLSDLIPLRRLVIGVAISGMMILIYGAIAQLTLLLRSPRRMVWGMGSIATLVIIPLIAVPILLQMRSMPALWLLTAFPWMAIPVATASSLVLAFVGQVLVLAALTAYLTRQLRQAGESETKALLSAGAL